MTRRISIGRAFLLTAFAAALILAAYFQTVRPTVRPYDPTDRGRSGLRALVLWLEALDHPVRLVNDLQTLSAGPGLLLISPSTSLVDSDVRRAINAQRSSLQERSAVAAWVEAGGTLLLVGPTFNTPLSTQFEIFVQPADFSLEDARQAQPLLPDLPAELRDIRTTTVLGQGDPPVWTSVIVDGDFAPVVMFRAWGAGTVWAMTEDLAFTNAHLRNDQIASLLPALLRTVPPGAPAYISLRHLQTPNATGDTITTLQDWLYTTPIGQALSAATLILLLFLLLQGRRLGPPIPTVTASRPRAAAEYVVAIAALQRRARQRRHLADHHAGRLKLAVGRAAHLDATLPNDAWLAQFHMRTALPAATVAEVERLLLAYDGADDDAELIRLVQATDALLASLPRTAMSLTR
jgi:hypothetical protein